MIEAEAIAATLPLDTIKAAGVMTVTGRDGKALFLQRSATGDHAGEWGFPGGKLEPGETTQDAAIRETKEEIGTEPGKIAEWTRQVADGVDFTTFVSYTDTEFTPTLDDEHTAWVWAPISNPPEPLHPGCRVALDRLTMDELGVAQAIAAGQLVSPQRYGNFWLYAIRITGTGMSYRAGLEEYCWRDPSLYMTDRFLQRCNGLAVLWNHTDAPKLNSDEYREKNVGSVFVPYFKGADEVWAVCKIYDEACLGWLMDGDKSTSPGVVFSGVNDNQTLERDDGTTLLIEGVPQLLDHVALCDAGVWDKGGPATGVDNFNLTEDTAMPNDEQATAKLDAILAGMAGITSRLDSVETDMKARKDAEEKQSRFDSARKDRFGPRKDGESRKDYMKRHDADETAMMDALKDEDDAEKRVKDCRMDAESDEAKKDEDFEKWAKEESEEPAHRDDKAKKDADPGEEEEKKADEERAAKDAAEMEKGVSMKDQARKDAAVSKENADLRAQVAALAATVRGMTVETPAADRDALFRAQSRADSTAAMFGDSVSAPWPGEKPLDYRKRLLEKFKKHSRLKDSRFDSLDEVSLAPLEDIVYADAISAARRPASAAPGRLVPIVERVDGRDVTRFHGDPMAWMGTFMRGSATGSFDRNPNRSN